MRSRFLSITAAMLITAVAVTGCGEKKKEEQAQQQPATTEQPAAAAPANDQQTASTEATQPAATQQAAATPATGGELQIYNWGDYTNPDLIKKFEEKYNVKVTVTDYDSND